MEISAIEDLPDISFIDNMTLEDVENILIEKFKKHYKENNGVELTLEKSDPYRLLLLTQAVLDYQMLLFIDKCGKMNLLKYSSEDFLDHLGAFKNRPRAGSEKARVQVLFSLAEVRDSVEPIPSGTMVTADQKVFFQTEDYAEIAAGELSATVTCVCTTEGSAGNDYAAGEISTLVTPTGFISSVINTTKSSGGVDEEDDEEYKDGIYQAPNKYSVAGPDDQWIAVIKDYNRDVADVMPDTIPGSGVASFTIVMKHGRLPDESEREDIRQYLLRPDIRTLGMNVEVLAPQVEEYDINLLFYIAKSKKDYAAGICEKVGEAIAEYICEQGTHEEEVEIGSRIYNLENQKTPAVGRDINPDDLLAKIKQAGAKRAVITAPVFTHVADNGIAGFSGNISVTYGGVESD